MFDKITTSSSDFYLFIVPCTVHFLSYSIITLQLKLLEVVDDIVLSI